MDPAVELERPERSDSYPVQQLIEYAQLLRKGGKVDVGDLPTPPIARSVRIDGFALATLTDGMRDPLALSDLQPVPRGERWCGHHENLDVGLVVIDSCASLRRAEQRNRALFVKSGLT